MKALFLVFHGIGPGNGISKKIGYQVKALRENGVATELCYYYVDANGDRKRMVSDHLLENFGSSAMARIIARISYRSLRNYILENHINLVYMRSFHNATPFLVDLIKQLKQKGVKVIMEIPTYPYDPEYQGFPLSARLGLLVDRLFRHALARQLHSIVTFSNEKRIFGTSTLQISNGIDFDSIPVKAQSRFSPMPTDIHLLGVAEVHYWHGYDRVLRGLAQYYQQGEPSTRVFFHIVGGIGPSEATVFDPIIRDNHLEPYVICHGKQDGAELDRLFEQAHFCIASLARHRSGITYIKTLKNREYAARGIPFIYSETDTDFEQQPYILKAPADESPIDIQQIIDFYQSREWIAQEIRNSVKHLSWKEQMKTIINTLHV